MFESCLAYSRGSGVAFCFNFQVFSNRRAHFSLSFYRQVLLLAGDPLWSVHRVSTCAGFLVFHRQLLLFVCVLLRNLRRLEGLVGRGRELRPAIYVALPSVGALLHVDFRICPLPFTMCFS